jgi:protein O-GlcNAc transferase
MSTSPTLMNLLQQGMQHLQVGHAQEADRLFRHALQLGPDSPQALYAIGLSRYQLQKLDDAESFLHRAISLEPRFFPAFGTLGLVLRAAGRRADGVHALEQALALKPDYAEAAYNLALIFGESTEPAELTRAVALYQRVLQIKPDFIAAHVNLGNVLRMVKRPHEGLPHLQQAVAAQPFNLEAQLNLALTLIDLGRYAEAIKVGEQLVARAPKDHLSWEALGNARLLAGDSGGAVAALSKADKLHPNDPALQYDLGVAEIANGDLDQGRATLDAVEKVRPEWLKIWFERDLALPPLYKNEAALDESRTRWIRGLERIENKLLASDDWSVSEALTAVSAHSAFYLNYQEVDNTALQKRFAHVVERVVQRAYPQFAAPLAPTAPRAPRERLRVGFVSAYLRKHSVGYFFGAWITALDQTKFESHVWHIGDMRDALTDKIAAGASHFHALSDDTEKIAAAIRAAELDVLIHLDIGMHPHAQVLASLRLAPVQCAAYGHPVTTGLSTIDYYLTADLAEPDNAAAHYSETLIRLPKLGVAYPMPDISRRNPPNSVSTMAHPLLLCTQRLFKVLPHFDRLAARIARQLPGCTLAFFATMSPSMNATFVARISAALRAEGVDAERTLRMLPSMTYEHFLGTVEAADLVLDTTYFSGGNSSFDTFAVATPIVTFEAPMMRGRQSAAMLTILGVPELIAKTDDAYVEIAVRYANDRAALQGLRERIRAAQPQLFDDFSTVRALENTLLSLAKMQKP